MAKKLDAVKSRNAVIGINKKIQLAVMTRTLGLGGDEMLREQIARLNKLCEQESKDGQSTEATTADKREPVS